MTNPAKVAYLVSQYPATSHTFIRREVEAMREAGVEVHTFSVRPPAEAERKAPVDRREFERTWYALPAKPLKILGAHLRAFRGKPGAYIDTFKEALHHRVPGTKAAVWSMFYFAEAITLADELDKRGIDHLHNHFANAGANVGYLASRFLNIGWSLTLHGISEFDYPAGPLLAEKILAANFIACVTHFGRAQAMRLVEPEHWEKLFVNRCGLDLSNFDRASLVAAEGDGNTPRLGPPPPPEGRKRVLSVGRLSAEKGHAGLIGAFAELLDEGLDLELRLVGDGPDQPQLERLIKRLDIGDRVTLVGRLQSHEVIAELIHADLFAMGSFMEGLPVVIMEALAMDVPVVAPGVAGIPELVEDKVSGLLFPPGDWATLRQKLSELLTDEELAARLAAEGKRRIHEEFAIERAVAPLLERFRNAT